MKNELKVFKCGKCGLLVEKLGRNNDEFLCCCEEKMKEVIPNSVDANVEKHKPLYEVIGDEILVKVPHVMEKEHYISWICLVKENKKIMVELYPEQECEVYFPYIKGATIYSYCNKHGLWSSKVED